jgi:hypothetical protein
MEVELGNQIIMDEDVHPPPYSEFWKQCVVFARSLRKRTLGGELSCL